MNMRFCEHTFVVSFKEYLSLANYRLSDFYNKIQLKSNLIINALTILAKFRAYDILFPLNLAVNASLDKQRLEWWNTLISNIDSNNELFDLTYNPYQKLINSKKKYGKYTECMSDYEYFQCSFSRAKLEDFVWQTCVEYYKDIYHNDKKSSVCLFTPGMYSRRIKYEFWENMSNRVLPELICQCKKPKKLLLQMPLK